jgi:hypothetical protein
MPVGNGPRHQCPPQVPAFGLPPVLSWLLGNVRRVHGRHLPDAPHLQDPRHAPVAHMLGSAPPVGGGRVHFHDNRHVLEAPYSAIGTRKGAGMIHPDTTGPIAPPHATDTPAKPAAALAQHLKINVDGTHQRMTQSCCSSTVLQRMGAVRMV